MADKKYTQESFLEDLPKLKSLFSKATDSKGLTYSGTRFLNAFEPYFWIVDNMIGEGIADDVMQDMYSFYFRYRMHIGGVQVAVDEDGNIISVD